MGVETGGCPHTAIREDASMNIAATAIFGSVNAPALAACIQSCSDKVGRLDFTRAPAQFPKDGIRQTRSPCDATATRIDRGERQVWYGISNAISPRHRWTTSIASGVHEHPLLPVPFES